MSKIVKKADDCQLSVDSVYLDILRGKLEMVWSIRVTTATLFMDSYGVS